MAGDRRTLDRRTVLRALTATGVGAAGCNALPRTPSEASEPVETDGGSPRDPAGEPTYERQPPQIETPWTAEVDPESPRPEYPRPQLVRDRWENLNGVWQFARASEGESPPVGEELDERILVPYPVESGLSGIKRHETRMWYRRGFEVPDRWLGFGSESESESESGSDGPAGRLLLHFERVDWEATVYVNGEEVTTHRGGYDHFVADVTDHLVESGPQELIVGVFDPTGNTVEPIGTQPKGRQGVGAGHPGHDTLWMTPTSGIWDTVWLEPVPEPHVTNLDLCPDLEERVLRVTVAASGDGARVEATALADGTAVGTASGPAGEELAVPVPDPRLWSPDDPFLYDLEVRLLDDGTAVDEVESYFGMRSLGLRTVAGTARPTLNGEVVYHLGTLESGHWPDGIYAAPTDEALRYNLEAQRELGYNMVRKHVKVEPRRWYYHADQVGLLVWQDVPNMPESLPNMDDLELVRNERTRAHFEREVREMVTELDNHPSLAVWIPINEGWGIDNADREYVRHLSELVADLDPERLVDPNSGYDVGTNNDSGAGDVKDVHQYPGPKAPPPEADRISALGEYSTPSVRFSEHTWGECGGHRDPERFVDDYVESVGELRRLAVGDGLSASVYTATTDLENICNGQITYDRKLVKAERADRGVERVRAAHERLLETATLLEHAALSVEAPGAYDPGTLGPEPEPFEVTATLANPESGAPSGATEAVDLSLSGVPEGWPSAAETPTAFDSVADGETVAATWQVTPEAAAGTVDLSVAASFRVGGETRQFDVERSLDPVLIARWDFDGSPADRSGRYAASLEGGVDYDAAAVQGSHALRFDGESGRALLSTFDGEPAFLHAPFEERTVSAWIAPEATAGRRCVYNEGGTVDGFGIRLRDGSLEAGVASGGAVTTVSAPFDRSGWTHVAAVFDRGALRLHVDGREIAADADVGFGAVSAHVAGSELGAATTTSLWDDGRDAFFDGRLDAVALYRRALSPDAVARLAERF